MQAGNPTIGIFLPERREQGTAPNGCLGNAKAQPHGIGLVEDHLEKIRRTGIRRDSDIGRRTGLQLGLTDARRQHASPHRARAVFKHQARRRQVIAETILHDVALTNAAGVQEPAHAPPVGSLIAGLVNRAGGLKDMGVLVGGTRAQPTKGCGFLLCRHQIRFAQHRQAGQIGPRGDLGRVHTRKPVAIAGQGLRPGNLRRQVPGNRGLARLNATAFQIIKKLRHNPSFTRLFGRHYLKYSYG